jgi:hypothetical protein
MSTPLCRLRASGPVHPDSLSPLAASTSPVASAVVVQFGFAVLGVAAMTKTATV